MKTLAGLVIALLAVVAIALGVIVRRTSSPPLERSARDSGGVPFHSVESDGTAAGSRMLPTYLLFQFFTYTPNPQGRTQPFDSASVRRLVDDLVSALGDVTGDGKTRQLGFSVGPLSLDHSDEELRAIIRESFSIADEKTLAVGFHLDDSMFWMRRADLRQDRNNVEWTDWRGTIAPDRTIGWAPSRLAPQLCYESPTVRKEITRIARDVIGKEIRRGLDMLEAKEKEYLFAGVIAGWETRLDDDRQPRVRVGYCSLHHLGFSAQEPPHDITVELEKVVQRWIGLWAKSLTEAGVPEDRLYTHVYPDESLHAPAWTAFNEYANPGFSIYPESTKKDFAVIYAELKKQERSRWALSEGTNTHVDGGTSGISWEEYLGGLVNHGASLVNIFAWQDTTSGYGRSTRSKDAVAAYQKFLKGERLSEERQAGSSVSDRSSWDLQTKIKRIQELAPAWLQRSSANQAKGAPLLQQLERYTKAGRALDAERVADEILDLIGVR